jgi:FKBP-type peptidyl-prolyl cis-trans isomerase
MAKKRERVAALVAATIFLVTSLGFSGLVIWQLVKGNNKTSTPSSQAQTNNSSQENKLEGTKLASFTPVDSVTELQIVDLKEGTGEVVKAGATVTAHYTGALAKDGTIFQSSHDTGSPATFGLDRVIKGWTEGVPGMKVGGTRRLIIPAAKAYGAQSPAANIPANSDLVFDIELVSVKQ